MMRRFLVYILFVYFHVLVAVSSETPDELLLALKQQYSQQPDCTPTFEIRHPRLITPNAIAQPSITTDADCRASCVRDEKCMSYQIDSRPGQPFCRLQPFYSIDDLQGPFSATDIKEYVFTVKCVNSTSKERCSPLIELRLRNWNSHLAREQLSVKSELECRAVCLRDQDCMSYQIDSRPSANLCYTNKDLEMVNKYQLYTTEDPKEYFVVDRCLDKYDVTYNKDCSPVFKRSLRPRKVSPMATLYPLHTTEHLCRLQCLFMPDCVSYQIDRNSETASFCSLQTNMNNLMEEKLKEVDLVTEYILMNPCTNRAFDKYATDCSQIVLPKPYPGISRNAQPHPNVASYAECRALCLDTPTCVSYQNSSVDVFCWTFSDWMGLMPNNAYYTKTVNEYVVARRCSNGSSSSTFVFEEKETDTPPEIRSLEECMPADKRSESDIVFAVCTAKVLKRDVKGDERLRALKTFLSNIVVSLNVAANKDRIGLVTFERNAYVEFYLNSYNDPKLIAEAVARVACHECNSTEAGVISALQTIQTKVLTRANGLRPDVPHIVIMITDRLSNTDLLARDAIVKDLLSAGTYIIPIGVTNMVDEGMLKGFASPRSDGNPLSLLWVNDFVSLNSLVYRIQDAIHDVLPAKDLRIC